MQKIATDKIKDLTEPHWRDIRKEITAATNIKELINQTRTKLISICGLTNSKQPENWDPEHTEVKTARWTKKKIRQLKTKIRGALREVQGDIIISINNAQKEVWENLTQAHCIPVYTEQGIIQNFINNKVEHIKSQRTTKKSQNKTENTQNTDIIIEREKAIPELSWWESLCAEANNTHDRITLKRHTQQIKEYVKKIRAAQYQNPKLYFKWLTSSNFMTRDTGIKVIRTENGITAIPEEVKTGVATYYKNLTNLTKEERKIEEERVKVLQAAKANEVVIITKEEVAEALAHLGKNKSPGLDGIPNEVWLSCREELLETLPNYFTQILNGTAEYPEEWKTAPVTLLPKAGDPLDVANYRPIALLDTMAKVYSQVLNNKLNRQLENNKTLVETQMGFRKFRSTQVPTAAICAILARRKIEKKKTHIMFLDLKSV